MRLLGAVVGALTLVACGSGSATGLGLEQAQGTGGFDGVFPFDANIPGTVPSAGGAASEDAGAPVDAGPDLGTLVVHWTFFGKRDLSYCEQFPRGMYLTVQDWDDRNQWQTPIDVPCDSFEMRFRVQPDHWRVFLGQSPQTVTVIRGQTTDVTVDFHN